MNRYPLWKYLIMIVAVVIGFFYTVPNIFPQVPAVQVSTNKTAVRLDAALLERVEKTLKTAGVAIASSELDPANGVHVRFAKGDSDSQVKAKELLLKDLNNGVADGTGNYIIALTSESTTPHWMQNLNAKPMALGLDLRGGVHFLMQVDMKGALDRAADRNASDIRSLMREKKIQYGGVDKSGETIAVKFSDPAQREKASREISDSNKDLLIKEDGAAQDLHLLGRDEHGELAIVETRQVDVGIAREAELPGAEIDLGPSLATDPQVVAARHRIVDAHRLPLVGLVLRCQEQFAGHIRDAADTAGKILGGRGLRQRRRRQHGGQRNDCKMFQNERATREWRAGAALRCICLGVHSVPSCGGIDNARRPPFVDRGAANVELH